LKKGLLNFKYGDRGVSYPTAFLLIKDYSWLRNLSKELQDFGIKVVAKTNPDTISDLIESNVSVHCFVVDLEIEDFEGLTIHNKLIKNQLYRHTPFVFLAEDDSINHSDNVLFNSALIINKKMPIEHIVCEIINKIRFPENNEDVNSYKTGATGNLKDLSLEQLIQFAESIALTGAIIVSHFTSTGVIRLKNGKVWKVLYKNLDKEEALDELSKLDSATFRLEHKIYGIDDINYFYEKPQEKEINAKDILIDLFYFTHKFFEEKIGQQITEFIFKNKIYEYSSLFSDIKKVQYVENSQEKIQIFGNIDNEQIDIIINLFREIFFELFSQNNDLSMEEFLANLDEIRPYLKQFNIDSKLHLKATH
jgi:hypothetical protein